MSLAKLFLPEFDAETAATRPLLERVPVRDFDWRPHPKSYSLGELASHTVNVLAWTMPTLKQSKFDLAPKDGKPWKSPFYRTRKALLEAYDANVAVSRKALASMRDPAWEVDWSLVAGPDVFFSMPRLRVFRAFILNHLIHHRAQLGVYLRLRDVLVPGVYGPSADEQ